MVKKCKSCGIPFRVRPSRAGQNFCSRQCAAAQRLQGTILTCGACGTDFYIKRDQLNRSPEHWCSRQCADIGRRKGEYRTCKVCDTSFYMHPSYITQAKRTGEYCSMQCYDKVKSQILTPIHQNRSESWNRNISKAKKGKPNLKARRPPRTIVCKQCGYERIFRGRQAYLAKQAQFCSTECWYAWARINKWEGKRPPIYYGRSWRSQAKLARERDDHTCQNCGRRQYNPRHDVHHTVPFRGFDDSEEANALSNLITLCHSCHIIVERS